MYLLPTSEELNKLWRQIDPKQRFLDAAAMAINELTKEAMPYFDEIEDDIISMRRNINGFLPYSRGIDSVNLKDRSFEYEKDNRLKKQLLNKPYVESVSSWEEI